MGLYNCFGERGIQLKAEDYDELMIKSYKIGDKINLPDGVYVANEGIVVIYRGTFVAEVDSIYDKYGGIINLSNELEKRNPIAQVIKEFNNENKE